MTLTNNLRLAKAIHPEHLENVLKVADIVFGKDHLFNKSQLEVLNGQMNTQHFVAYLEKEAVGFIGVTVVADEMEIIGIAVMPDMRHAGVGKWLIEQVITEEVASVFLEVRSQNQGARTFYKTLHFKEIGQRKNYYSHPSDDAIIMKKEVNVSEC